MLILEAKTSFETLEPVPLVFTSTEIEPSFLKLDLYKSQKAYAYP